MGCNTSTAAESPAAPADAVPNDAAAVEAARAPEAESDVAMVTTGKPTGSGNEDNSGAVTSQTFPYVYPEGSEGTNVRN